VVATIVDNANTVRIKVEFEEIKREVDLIITKLKGMHLSKILNV